MARGSITKRGEGSWRIKFSLGTDPATGERRTQYATVRGTKKQAQAELTKRLAEVDEGSFVERSATTVGQYARHWISSIAPAKVSPKTLERYTELVEKHIIPRLGATALQRLDGPRLDAFYTELRTAGRLDGKGGLAPLTVLHIHRLVSQILSSAVKARKLRSSPMEAVQTTPKAKQEEIQILTDAELAALLGHLQGRTLYVPVMVAVATGMRRGEVLGLRWKDIDLASAALSVAQVLELTREGVTVKAPKTERSRRTIALPSRVVEELKSHKKAQAEFRLKLGLGRDERDLVFPAPIEGGYWNPSTFGRLFAREADAAKVGHVTFHGLRHTHITNLLRNKVPVHIVSKRAGHAKPAITLNIYSHVMADEQDGAAAIVDSALRTALQDRT